jgi:UDP-2,4-diacetamido-2,4,6-trideoxy-beta-L-altropyranose hydrolase
MKVVFRVDSATRMGSGHLMRCITLAEELRDQTVQVSFVCRELSGNLIALLRTREMSVFVLPVPTTNPVNPTNNYAAWLGVSQAEDAAQTILALGGEKPDWLVIDHYGLDVVWEKTLRSYCGRMMVIDDLANRQHDCDVLLDQNYSVESVQRYKALVPKPCQVLLGPSYALLRKEFQILRQQQAGRGKALKQLLVFFTAGDDQGETLKAMQGIALYGKAEQVDVVIGSANPDMLAIKSMCITKNWGYHCQVDYMPTLIARADLVIGAGGSSNWERCALGTPALVVILAENQAVIALALDSAGVVINLGWNTNMQATDYATALYAITPQRLASLSEHASRLVDAKGVQRVVEILYPKKHLN